jgi:hypothetical protein
MEFIKFFFMGFLLNGKQRLFSLLLCLMFVVFIDMYAFSPNHFITAVLLWCGGIGLFWVFNLTLSVAMTLVSFIATTTWCFTHFNDTIIYHIQNIFIALTIIWLLETIINYREFRRRK